MKLMHYLLSLVLALLVSCVLAPASYACSQPPVLTITYTWPPNLLVGIIVNNVPNGTVSTAYTNWNIAMATPVAICSPTFVLSSGEPGTIKMSYAPIPPPANCPSGQTCYTRGITDLPNATFTSSHRLQSVGITINSAMTNTAAITEVVAHEIGHTLGLLDCNYPGCPTGSSVMEAGAPTTSINGIVGQPGPTPCDIAAVLLVAPDYLCAPPSGGTGGTGCGGTNDDGTPQPLCPTGKASPVILDLNGHGFDLTSAANGVMFNISGTGTPVQMGWIASGADNAFLALPGVDGLVHNGQQLFGNFTPQPPCPANDTTCAPNGFRALAVYDLPANGGNGDGIIDARDAIFSSLRQWIDANHDGVSQPEELHSLSSLGINSISLTYKADEKTDQYGNIFRYRAQVNPDNPTDAGKTAYDIFFVLEPLPNTAKVVACPAPPATGKRPASSILKH
jgi:hypothetical protein